MTYKYQLGDHIWFQESQDLRSNSRNNPLYCIGRFATKEEDRMTDRSLETLAKRLKFFESDTKVTWANLSHATIEYEPLKHAATYIRPLTHDELVTFLNNIGQ